MTAEEEMNKFKALCEKAASMFDDLAERIKAMAVSHEDGSMLNEEEKQVAIQFSAKLIYLSKHLREIIAKRKDWSELTMRDNVVIRETMRILERIKKRKDDAIELSMLG